jgi:hypothetical protein
VVLEPEQDPRVALADWMTAADNPFFARSLVNRYWKHFLDRGLVEPEDDMRETNPPTNPELLDMLAKRFVESEYDLQALIRMICQSRVYQLRADPNDANGADGQSYSRFYPRRLQAEVLLDAVDQFIGANTAFAGMPVLTRAVQLPDSGLDVYFLNVFGRPRAMSACECERTSDANLVQSLHLLNSASIQNKLAAESARPHQDSTAIEHDAPGKIRDTYLRAFCREPTEQEMADLMDYLNRHGAEKQEVEGQGGEEEEAWEKRQASARQAAYEDLYWALINSKEFLFNH